MSIIDERYEAICQAWKGKGAKTARELADLLDEYKISFAYNSGKIENQAITYHDTRSIFESGTVSGFSGDPRALFEIQNQRECHDVLLDAFERKLPLDEALLLNTHRTLTQGTYDKRRWERGERPGNYKTHDYVVGVADVGVPAKDVPAAVAGLLAEIEVADELNALTVAAYFHLSLESIHPFADGNGRVGRALMNYLFVCNGHPPVIIFEKDRLAYYGAIEAWDESGDLAPMREFLKIETIKTWDGRR